VNFKVLLCCRELAFYLVLHHKVLIVLTMALSLLSRRVGNVCARSRSFSLTATVSVVSDKPWLVRVTRRHTEDFWYLQGYSDSQVLDARQVTVLDVTKENDVYQSATIYFTGQRRTLTVDGPSEELEKLEKAILAVM
jgi:hypothetical protein